MSQLIIGKKIVSGEYNFATDASAGAIGTVNTGVKIPRFSWITSFKLFALNSVTSAGAATISWGTRTSDLAVPVQNNTNLFIPLPFGAYTGAGVLPGNVAIQAFPLRFTNDVDVVMVIGGAPITGGRIMFAIEYNVNLL